MTTAGVKKYKLIGCHGIKSMNLIRVDDIPSLGPYNIWHRNYIDIGVPKERWSWPATRGQAQVFAQVIA